MKSSLDVPLTPLQHALNRLEEDKIVKASFEKNRKVYEICFSHPFFNEINALLKKIYNLLPTDMKRKYCFVHSLSAVSSKDSKSISWQKSEMLSFFKRLSKVRSLTLTSYQRVGSETKIKRGKALVSLSQDKSSELIFQEKGSWFQGDLPNTSFTNSFRWLLNLDSGLISLEHLRYGIDKPIFLFNLSCKHSGKLESINPHLCDQDSYLGNVEWKSKYVCLNIRVIGPKKDDFLYYNYT